MARANKDMVIGNGRRRRDIRRKRIPIGQNRHIHINRDTRTLTLLQPQARRVTRISSCNPQFSIL
jgi:hypothetical protein